MKRWPIVLLVLGPLAAFAWILTPALLLQPFQPQTPGGVALAYQLRASSPIVAPILLLLGLWAIVRIWPRARWWGRVPATLSVLLLAGCALLSRQNHFEWMFRPLPRPAFAGAADATFLSGDDVVLGVAQGGASRAYPVRAMAYHHLLNDRIGDEPIVATY